MRPMPFLSELTKLENARMMIDHWQKEMNTILERNWERKRKLWVTHCSKALKKICGCGHTLEWWEPPTMMPSQLNDLSKLDWQEQHWIEVLAGSARVERLIAPAWAELIQSDRLDNWSENQEGIATELSCRFGLHNEWILCAIREGLRGSNTWDRRLSDVHSKYGLKEQTKSGGGRKAQ